MPVIGKIAVHGDGCICHSPVIFSHSRGCRKPFLPPDWVCRSKESWEGKRGQVCHICTHHTYLQWAVLSYLARACLLHIVSVLGSLVIVLCQPSTLLSPMLKTATVRTSPTPCTGSYTANSFPPVNSQLRDLPFKSLFYAWLLSSRYRGATRHEEATQWARGVRPHPHSWDNSRTVSPVVVFHLFVELYIHWVFSSHFTLHTFLKSLWAARKQSCTLVSFSPSSLKVDLGHLNPCDVEGTEKASRIHAKGLHTKDHCPEWTDRRGGTWPETVLPHWCHTTSSASFSIPSLWGLIRVSLVQCERGPRDLICWKRDLEVAHNYRVG